MIPFNFVYCRADSLDQASELYTRFESEGKSARYYAGGSEIITMCRTGSMRPDAVIDMKQIPECRLLSLEDGALRIGAACTLSHISRSNLFPLLRLACGRIADHTNQCRITLGGNLCGTIRYREASLPLLLCDATLMLFGPQGERTVPFQSVFDGRMRLSRGELIVQILVPRWALEARHFHIKKTTNEKIDYPLVSVSALCHEGRLLVGFSGVCADPFRSEQMEATLNDHSKPPAERAALAAAQLPGPVISDTRGSGEYRIFVLKNTLRELVEEWEDGAL